MTARVPPASADADQTAGLAELLASLETAEVVLFPDIWPGDLDGFFRLRLLQVLDRRAPLPGLSVIVLSADMQGPPLPQGFADRFRSAWPFARCVFLTEGGDHHDLSGRLGLPVMPLDRPHEIVRGDADAGQAIAVQVQKPWGRCGSTILFENQVESLVAAGFLTIRLFADPQWRRGATMAVRLEKAVRENSVNAGAHINVAAVPDGPPYSLRAGTPDAAWRKLLAASATGRPRDDAIGRAIARAECVIANHLECFGPALALAPRARLMLAVHEDRARALHDWSLLNGRTEAVAATFSTAASRAQAAILHIADICTFVSVDDLERLRPGCRRAAGVLPRVYGAAPPDGATPRFDLLLVGAEHGPNILSIRWFLDQVWRPHLEARRVSVAVVGRAGLIVQAGRTASPLLHFLGFVEDLEAIRSWCRLTVVPDRGGSGISTKMLTTIASGHPLATTSHGLRGLGAAIAGGIPAHDDARALAADILALTGDKARLAERRDQVRSARAAATRAADHAALAMSVPRPDDAAIRARLEKWVRLAGSAEPLDRTPYVFPLGTAFPLSGHPADPRVLLDGWHEAETWGRWTDGTEASIRIALSAPADEPLAAELDLVPSAVRANLRIGIDGTMLALADPVLGWNTWDVPPELTAGKTSFVLSLHAGEAVCPASSGDSPDDRMLGIGVVAVRVARRQVAAFPFGELVPVSAGAMPRGIQPTGWHPPEDWGRWSSRPAAALRLALGSKPADPLRLELDLAPMPGRGTLTLTVNNMALPAVAPVPGLNRFDLPLEATEKRGELHLRLAVQHMFCPARAGQGADDRELGVGLRGVRLTPYEPVYLTPGERLPVDQAAALDELLLDGWHQREDWGCWMNRRSATFRLMFREKLSGLFRLELDLAEAPVAMGLTLAVNGTALPEIAAVSGSNAWTLQEAVTSGQRSLLVQLRVSDMFRPAAFGGSTDTRAMGAGLRAVTLHRDAAAACPIGQPVEMTAALEESGVLLDGWHGQEDWGRWSSGGDALILLRFAAPLSGPCALEFDMMLPVLDKYVALSVNGTVLPPLAVQEGPNAWAIPESCTNGQTSLRIHLLIALPARPMDVIAGSRDDRVLGVGIRRFRVLVQTGG